MCSSDSAMPILKMVHATLLVIHVVPLLKYLIDLKYAGFSSAAITARYHLITGKYDFSNSSPEIPLQLSKVYLPVKEAVPQWDLSVFLMPLNPWQCAPSLPFHENVFSEPVTPVWMEGKIQALLSNHLYASDQVNLSFKTTPSFYPEWS